MEELLGASTDELLANIGRELQADRLLPQSVRDAIQAGRAWFEENFEDLRRRICPHVADVEAKPSAAEAVAALADLLASVHNVPAVASVSVIVYRYGVGSLCADGI